LFFLRTESFISPFPAIKKAVGLVTAAEWIVLGASTRTPDGSQAYA
jgi:hypothetical protein